MVAAIHFLHIVTVPTFQKHEYSHHKKGGFDPIVDIGSQ